jgi:hypothetical protein
VIAEGPTAVAIALLPLAAAGVRTRRNRRLAAAGRRWRLDVMNRSLDVMNRSLDLAAW